jgi:hypothetical protein
VAGVVQGSGGDEGLMMIEALFPALDAEKMRPAG